jgi:hypothetical protein
MRACVALITLILPAAGCLAPKAPPPAAPEPPAAAAPVPHTRAGIEHPELHGASGLTRDAQGHLWTVLERAHTVFELTFAYGAPTLEVLGSRPVQGAGEVDLEAVALLDDGRLAFGTETKDTDRTGDTVLFAQVTADAIVVEGKLEVPYAPWGLEPERNRGIEGLCQAGGRLVVGIETVGEDAGRRFAPVAVYSLLEQAFTHYRLWLTSEAGKLSALTCRATPGGTEVYAIERHYEVARVLRFELPLAGKGGDLTPQLVLDLKRVFEGAIPNFEGIAVMKDGSLVLISDNDYGGVTGPTELLALPAPGGPSGHLGIVQ